MGHVRRLMAAGAVTMMAASLVAPVPMLAQGRSGGEVQPFTLDLLVQDPMERQAGIVAQDLVRVASEASGGAITIVPTFDGQEVASAVRAGDTDLGILPSRDWDAQGVTSFDALEAPFLVDDDALAEAIASSDIATRLMSGLGAIGVAGLAIWPEDLRHLFAFDKSGRVFDSPESLKDAVVLVVAGAPGNSLIPTLGGTVYQEGVATGDLTGDRGADAETGALAGGVFGLWGAGLPTTDVTVAGDMPIFAKYQTLVANPDTLAGLTDPQRKLLDEVVRAALAAALDEHFAEPELATALCASGATVSEIGPDAIAAFRGAAQPLTDELMGDPVTGALMADIAALDEATPDARSAGTCSPSVAASTVSPGGDEIGDRLPPNGTWRIQHTADELVSAGVSRSFAADNAGTWTWTFRDGTWELVHDVADGHCAGHAVPVDGVIRLTTVADDETTCTMDIDIRWRLDDVGQLYVRILVEANAPDDAALLRDDNRVVAGPWTPVHE